MFKEKLEQELTKGESLSIIKIVDYLLLEAHERNASDIHIDPGEHTITVRFRIDGILIKMYELKKSLHSELFCRIKILAKLRTDEHQTPQDGRLRINYENIKIDIRVSCIPTFYGESGVLRILKDIVHAENIQDLGFTQHEASTILGIASRKHGMIIVTGPTGSGKTTTLYTLLKIINSSARSIVTIEDPIEYALPGIRHIQVNPSRGLSFSQGLRAIMRQDPDVIMIGEIRDSETAAIAIQMALTGHLVVTSMHTPDAATTIPRLIDMGIEPYLIASTINLIIGQRLLRKLCTLCNGQGCNLCNESGYKDRIGICETLVIDEKIRNKIKEESDVISIRNIAKKQGMQSMYEIATKYVEEGITSISEVLNTFHE